MIAGVEALSQAVELPKLVKLPDIFLYTESMTPPHPPPPPKKEKASKCILENHYSAYNNLARV